MIFESAPEGHDQGLTAFHVTRNGLTNGRTLVWDKAAAERNETADEASIGMIKCGKWSITNTLNESTRMAWYWSATLILSAAIPWSISLKNGNYSRPSA
jgi:hypothetical protein